MRSSMKDSRGILNRFCRWAAGPIISTLRRLAPEIAKIKAAE